MYYTVEIPIGMVFFFFFILGGASGIWFTGFFKDRSELIDKKDPYDGKHGMGYQPLPPGKESPKPPKPLNPKR